MKRGLSTAVPTIRTLLLSLWVLLDSLGVLLRRVLYGLLFSRRRSGPGADFEVIAISQVPWDYLWQRNHHTMSRISERRKVLYCCPIPTVTAAKEEIKIGSLTARSYNENLMYFRPIVLWGDSRVGAVRYLNRLLLRNFIKWHAVRNGMGGSRRILWYYFPTYEMVAGHLNEDLVLYDIQDEYSAFSWFPPDTAELERRLLGKCDLVFTGTLQLWKRKNRYNRNMHFIQCGVDSEHFKKALNEDAEAPSDMMGLKKPILGYFGLVDTRVDMDLLEAVASQKPDWTIVLIGPSHVEKRASNILMMGRRTYDELPGYLKSFDVCLIPFVLNENTRNLNPTKLLEYFASGKPVISTPIPDVIDLYSDLVEIASTPEEVMKAVYRVLSDEDGEKARKRMREAAENSWEGMVESMLSHIERTFKEKKI
ncbi:MAG: glycosyltransferase [Candidatus Glassbacteria bacterium]